MKKSFLLFGVAAASSFFAISNAHAQDAINSVSIQQVAHSTVINKPCKQVWPLITDFGGISSWYRGFSASSQIAGPTNQVGAVRKLTRSSNGNSFEEKMILLDKPGYSLAYSHILNGPVRETINQVRLADLNSKSQCLATWGSTFRLKPEQMNDASKIRGFFVKAFIEVLEDLKVASESP